MKRLVKVALSCCLLVTLCTVVSSQSSPTPTKMSPLMIERLISLLRKVQLQQVLEHHREPHPHPPKATTPRPPPPTQYRPPPRAPPPPPPRKPRQPRPPRHSRPTPPDNWERPNRRQPQPQGPPPPDSWGPPPRALWDDYSNTDPGGSWYNDPWAEPPPTNSRYRSIDRRRAEARQRRLLLNQRRQFQLLDMDVPESLLLSIGPMDPADPVDGMVQNRGRRARRWPRG